MTRSSVFSLGPTSLLKTESELNSPLFSCIYVKFPKNNRKQLIFGLKNKSRFILF